MKKRKDSAEKAIRDIRRVTRRQYSAEEKIRIVLEGLPLQTPQNRPDGGRSSSNQSRHTCRWCTRRF